MKKSEFVKGMSILLQISEVEASKVLHACLKLGMLPPAYKKLIPVGRSALSSIEFVNEFEPEGNRFVVSKIMPYGKMKIMTFNTSLEAHEYVDGRRDDGTQYDIAETE